MKRILLLLASCFLFLEVSHAQPAIQWQKCLGGTDGEWALSVQQTTDGGFIVAGFTASNDGDVAGFHGVNDYWVVKLDSSGTIEWQKCLGGSGDDVALAVKQTADGGYIVAGGTNSNDGDVTGNHGFADYWIVKLNSNGSIQWQKCLGGTNNERARSVQQTADGGYIVAGYTTSNDGDVTGYHFTSDYWVVKLDSSGSIQWQKCLGGNSGEDAFSVKQTADGGFIVAGWTQSNDGDVTGNHGNNRDYWVVKLDGSGNIQWQKCLGGTGYEATYSVQQTADGGYMVVGSTLLSNNGDVTNNHGAYDYWVVKLDGSGNIQWQKCLGGALSEEAKSIQQTADGGYMVAGYTGSNDGDVGGNHGAGDYWVVKLDGSGNLQWQKCLGGTSDDVANAVQQTADGGYIVAGRSDSNDGDVTGLHGNDDYWVVKLAPFVSIDELAEEENLISLFPNPAFDELTIDNGELKIEGVEIYNTLGEKRLTPTLSKGEGARVDVTSLPAGVYFVAATDDKGNKITKRFIKM